MFDKLIESNSDASEFKPRRKFFMVSSVVVGIMFLSAVVFSLYAQDIDLGTENFELAELLAPVAPDAPEPEPPRQQPQEANQQETSDLPSRQQLIAQIDQTPKAPPAISTTPFKGRVMPDGIFELNPSGPEADGRARSGNPEGTSSATSEPTVVETVKAPEPPPVVAKVEPKRPTTVTKGVVNGTAIDLPKPPYPAVARSINLRGSVNVQVLIDESGNVVSARAVDGHPFFKQEAERAARRAKFRPTLLGDTPVKVNGVIVYRFTN